MTMEPVFTLRATAIVGCAISLFFCFLSMVAFLWFRPQTESMTIKKHLTVALASTQLIFLISIEGFKSREGCLILSVLGHFTASACFSWCALDALGLYFFHANTSPAIRNPNFYFVTGWGSPIIVIILTILIGFLDQASSKTIALYTCWSSDNVIWAFVVSSTVMALVNIGILLIILKQLRQPSYDISPKAAIEKRGTRYGLRTNSLMLLGLCLGWIFTILSFTEESNLRYQLTFGLINGLQGIFLFFFHCLLNSDHVKGYSSGSKRGLEESGRSPTSDSVRSKRQEFQSGSTKGRSSNRSSGKLENVPLISLTSTSKLEEKSECTVVDQPSESPPLIKSENIQIVEKDNASLRQPDLDIIQQLPGIPDMTTDHLEAQSFNKKLQSGDCRGSGRSRSKRPKTADNQLQVYEDKSEVERRRKSSSEPAISSGQLETIKGSERAAQIPTPLSEYLPDAEHRRTPRPQTSVNELESLFSGTECFVKPHSSSLSSIPRRERSSEGKKPKSLPIADTPSPTEQMAHKEISRTSSQNPNQTNI